MLACSPLAVDPLTVCTPLSTPTVAVITISDDPILAPKSVTIEVMDLDRAGQGVLSITLDTVSGDMETLLLTEVMPGVFQAPINVVIAAAILADGVIQGTNGDILTATVIEQGGGPITDTATILDAAMVSRLTDNRRTLFERRGGFIGRR